MIRSLAMLAIACLSQICNAAKPCEAVSSKILEDAGYQERSKAVLGDFGRCIATQDVCSLTQAFDGSDGKVSSANSPSKLSTDGKGRSSVAVAIQDGRQGSCYLAVYSGGSAAAWLITGWTVKQRVAQVVPRIDQYGAASNLKCNTP